MTNFLISFFAVKRDLLCLITLGQLFQSLTPSFMKVFFEISDSPISKRLFSVSFFDYVIDIQSLRSWVVAVSNPTLYSDRLVPPTNMYTHTHTYVCECNLFTSRSLYIICSPLRYFILKQTVSIGLIIWEL